MTERRIRNPEKRENWRFRKFMLDLSRIVTRLIFRLEFAGLEHLPTGGPGLLVANHVGMLDMFVLQPPIRPWVYWVAKKELFTTRLGAVFYRALGAIPVDRSQTDPAAVREMIQTIRRQGIIGLFPEGHRVRPEQIGHEDPRAGALQFAQKFDLPVWPVGIKGRYRLWGQIRVVYGAPFRIREDQELNDLQKEPIEQTRLLMRRIYALTGQNYPMRTDSKRKRDNERKDNQS